MDKRSFWTIIKGDVNVFGRNDYVRGVIMGIQYVVCGKGSVTTPLFVDEETGDAHFGIKCSEKLYGLFADIVEKKYPGLCEFDAKVEIGNFL